MRKKEREREREKETSTGLYPRQQKPQLEEAKGER